MRERRRNQALGIDLRYPVGALSSEDRVRLEEDESVGNGGLVGLLDRTGDLEAVRLGRRTIRVRVDSLDRLIDAHPVNTWRGRSA